MKKKVILDVDTGSDDAIAIMTALLSPDIEVVAICTVWGNTALENTTENTLRLLSRMGLEIPVYAGVPTALAKYLSPERDVPAFIEAEVDGEVVKMHDDLFDLPEPDYTKEDLPAPFFYIDYLSETEEPVDIVAVGPLTNLGFVLSLKPEIAAKINSLTIMGGGYNVANVTGSAEANFWHDPEAVQIILDSGVHPTIVPLDATHKAIITKEEISKLRASDNFCSNFAAGLMEQRVLVHSEVQPLYLPDSATVHDALAVAALVDREVLQDVKDLNLNVCFTGVAEGRCVIDRREAPAESNCSFAFSADRERFVGFLIDTFKNFNER